MFNNKGKYRITFLTWVFCALSLFSAASGLSDTTEKKSNIKFTSRDSAEVYGRYLLSTDPIFMDHWQTESAFVFDDVALESLPEEIILPLVKGKEQFTLTWYGRINSTYKRRWGRQHHGLDIELETGDTVVAAFDGVVRYAQFNRSGFGNCVIIRHLNGLETIYAHLSKIDVGPNEFISSGQPIGLGGNTGHSKGSHLHFETRYKDFSFDPLLYIDINTQSLRSDTLVLNANDLKSYRKKTNPVKIVVATPDTTSHFESSILNPPVAIIDNSPDIACVVSKEWLSVLESNKHKNKTTGTSVKKIAANKEHRSSEKKTGKTYTIKPGDNLGFISEKTGVPVSKLRKLNVIKSDRKLMPGQVLRLN